MNRYILTKLITVMVLLIYTSLLIPFAHSQEETLSILTYYPAPFAIFRVLNIGQENNFLSIFYDPSTLSFVFSGNNADSIAFSTLSSNSLVIGQDGMIGVGNNQPAYNLDVSGSVGIKGSQYNTNPALVVTNAGLVGIGTLSPNAALHISPVSGYGDAHISQTLSVGGDSEIRGDQYITYGDCIFAGDVNTSIDLKVGPNRLGEKCGVDGAIAIGPASVNAPEGTMQWNGTDFMGKTGPTENDWKSLTAGAGPGVSKITVGSTELTGDIMFDSGDEIIQVTANKATSSITISSNGSGSIMPYETPSLNFIPKFFTEDEIGNSSIYNDSSGNIGIGTTTPNAALQVIGSITRSITLKGTNTATHINLGIDSITGKTEGSSGYCTISGGRLNTASGDYSVISGGYNNKATGDYAAIGGGFCNLAGNSYSFVGGGAGNTSAGQYSAVSGGYGNTATGQFSYAIGNSAKALNDGCFVWNGSSGTEFTSTANNQFCANASGGFFFFGIADSTTVYPTIRYDNTTGQLYYYSSSIKYKENIQSFTDNFCKILELMPKSFTYKETGEKSFGYVAEDLDSLGLKNLVCYDNEGRPESISYELLNVYLIEILKKQHNKLNNLKNQSASCKKKVIGPVDLQTGDVVEYIGETISTKDKINSDLEFKKVKRCTTEKSKNAFIILCKTNQDQYTYKGQAIYEILSNGIGMCGRLKGTGKKGDFLVSTNDSKIKADNKAPRGSIIGQLLIDVDKGTEDPVPIRSVRY